MEKKLIIPIIIFLFIILIVGAGEIDYFDNSLTVENLTFTGDENITRNMDLEKYFNVTYAVLNLSGFKVLVERKIPDDWSNTVGVSNPANAVDDDWSNFASGDGNCIGTGNKINHIFENYTIDITNSDNFSVLFKESFIGGGPKLDCYNTTDWVGIIQSSPNCADNCTTEIDITCIKNPIEMRTELFSFDGGIFCQTDNYYEQQINFTQYTVNTSLEIGIPDGSYEWEHSGYFGLVNNVTADFSSSINDYLSTCTPDTNGNCSVPFLFHSDTGGIIEYSVINVTYDDYSPLIIDNYTQPATPVYDNDFFVSALVQKDTLYNDDINEVRFTITAPNGTILENDVNGTNDNETLWNSSTFGITSTTDNLGIWTWSIKGFTNISYLFTSSGTFEVTDTTSPTIRTVDSPINNSYHTTSDIDINLTSEDDVEIDTTWANIEYTNGTVIVSNFTINSTCGNKICGTNLSQYAFPVRETEDLKLNVWINDTSNNQDWLQVNLSVGIDTSSPDITKPEPSGTKTSFTIPIEFSITDNVNVDTCEWNITYTILPGTIINQSGLLTNCSIDELLTLASQSENIEYTFNIQTNDTSNNWKTGSNTFTVDLPEGVTPGGGGGGPPVILKALNEPCTSDSECQSGICDLNGKNELTKNKCVTLLQLCGNQYCDEDKGEDNNNCQQDCSTLARLGAGWGSFSIFAKGVIIVMLLSFTILLVNPDVFENIEKRFKGKK